MLVFDRSQMHKGLLEGCILTIIQRCSTYGYDIALQLAQAGFAEVKEGTIYPLLVRLEKKDIITAEYRPSPLGPARKYYAITDEGTRYLQAFDEAWRETSATVGAILGGDGNDPNL